MRVQLIITMEQGAEETKEFHQERISIGRSHKNDVILSSDNVSREHAVITIRNDTAYFTCQGKFGASHNLAKVSGGEELPLSAGDRIEICGNVLVFRPLAEPVEVRQKSQPESLFTGSSRADDDSEEAWLAADSQTGVLEDYADEAKTLARELDVLYLKNAAADSAARKQILKEALKKRLVKLGSKGREKTVYTLKERFYNKEDIWEHVITENRQLQARLETYRGKEGLAMPAYNALAAIAKHLVAHARPFQSEDDLAVFGENLRRTMETLLKFFSELEEGRLKGAEGDLTQLSPELLGPTPLRHAKSLPELGRYLLNWDNWEERRQAHTAFESALRDLLFHELALQEGYGRSLKNGASQLLHRLDPNELMQQIDAETIGFGFLKISKKRLSFFYSWLCWRRYKKVFKELKKQDRAAFHEWFAPPFLEGYRNKFQELQVEKSKTAQPIE